MKKLLIALLALICSTSLYPFFAIQRWVHPQTGQIIEEYFDWHNSTNKIARKQQADFVWACKQNGNDGLAVIEDAEWYCMLTSWLPKLFIKMDYNLVNSSPLGALVSVLEDEGLPVVNVDCRPGNYGFDQDVLDHMVAYNDGPLLNQFYQSIPTLVREILEYDQRKPEDERLHDGDGLALYGDLCVDVQLLHVIHANKDKKILRLAAGADHIAHINYFLNKMGWIPEEPHISPKLAHAMQTRAFIGGIVNTFFNYRLDCKQFFEHIFKGVNYEEVGMAIAASEYPVDIKAIYREHYSYSDLQEEPVPQASFMKTAAYIASALAGGYAIYKAYKTLSTQNVMHKLAEYIR